MVNSSNSNNAGDDLILAEGEEEHVQIISARSPGRFQRDGYGGYYNRQSTEETNVFEREYSDDEDVDKLNANADVQVDLGEDDDDSFDWKTFMKFVGPGFLMCIGYVDPGNFESDLQAGLQFNYKLLWVLVWATIAGLHIQSLCIRLALSTGWHLARCYREEYDKNVVRALWVVSELGIIASDVPEVIGTALALKLIFNIPTVYGVFMTSLSTFVFLGLQHFGVRKLEAFMASLVGIMSLCYLGELFYCDDLNFTEVLVGAAVPRIPSTQAMFIAVSLLGAVVMPHNLFLHSALVLTRGYSLGEKSLKKAFKYNLAESGMALTVTLFINFAVVIVAATEMQKITDPIERAEMIDKPLQNAPKMLNKLLGSAAKGLFSAALLASGQSSTITGTYAGQYVMDGFLKLRIHPGLRAFATRACAIVPSLTVVLLAGDEDAETLIVISSAILSIQLPFALIPLVKFCSSTRIVGDAFVLKGRALKGTNILSGVIVCANVILLLQTVFTSRYVDATFGGIVLGMFAMLFIIGYCYCIYWLLAQPVRQNLKSRTDRRLGLDNNFDRELPTEVEDDDDNDQIAMLRVASSSS
jgi:natural resistance-associated macrophage protein 2